MYILKITTAYPRKEKHPDWASAVRAGKQMITILFPSTEWNSMGNMLEKSGEVHAAGIRIEVYDEKMEAWH